jgi:hypothetical protein
MVPKTIAKILIVTIALILSGCGYYNPYVVHGDHPISLQRTMWSNRTTEIGLENTLFQAQADWLRKSPLINFADSKNEADYILTGSIDRVTYPEISFGAYREGIEGRAELTVSFSITDRKSGQVTWQQKGGVWPQTFLMTQDPVQLQANKNGALQEIADDIGEAIYLHLINTMTRLSLQPSTK